MIHFGPGAFAAAFAAGFITFLSPCVLPLVPGYLSFITGLTTDAELAERKRRVVAATATFVVGFGAMFVAFGAGAALFGDVLLTNRRTLEVVAGIFLVLAGLLFVGVRMPLAVVRERRFHLHGRLGRLTPLVAGATFAVGWTPCVGPTLAAILALSARGANPAQGAVLLGVFSIGLGIPFLVFGLMFTQAVSVATAMRTHSRRVMQASGALLIVFGVLLATGQLAALTARLTGLGIDL